MKPPEFLAPEIKPPLAPSFLGGDWKSIGQTFGVGSRTAREWYDRGAPIILVGKKPVAEAWELWEWLKDEYG